MAVEDTIEGPRESPHVPSPEGRAHAEQVIAARLAGNEEEHRMLKRLRDHLAGKTPVGEALSFFYGESRLEVSESAAVRDLKVAERVVIDFFKDTARYREAWEGGVLGELVIEEASRFNPDRFGAQYVGSRLHQAFDAQFSAERGKA